MVLKRCCDQLKAAWEAFVLLFNKKRSETSSFPILDQCKIDDNKFSTTVTSNKEDDSQIWFQNESINEIDLDSEEKSNNENDNNLEEKHLKTEKKASLKVLKQELKQNKEGENSLCKGYGIRLRSFRKRKRKSVWELENEGLKSYNNRVLWQ